MRFYMTFELARPPEVRSISGVGYDTANRANGNSPKNVKRPRKWYLSVITSILLLTGCLTPGDKFSSTKDPFLEPTATSPIDQQTAAPAHLMPLPPVTILAPTTQNVALVSFDIEAPTPISEEPITSPGAIADTEAFSVDEGGVFPIDLANALALGGADNLQVRLARTRLFQAQAEHLKAKSLWLPSLRLGIGYNKHDGRLQETTGPIFNVERNSLFYGGGLGLGSAPLNGGAGGPPRLMVNLSLADAYFKPLAASQVVAARGAAERAASNDSLAEIAVGYHSLLEAQGHLANAIAARDLTQNMVNSVESFHREGFSSKTEIYRAQTELGRWQLEVVDAKRVAMGHSAELARILRLPAQIRLVPAEEFLLPVDFIDASMDYDVMIAMAWHSRPEISEYASLRDAAGFRVKEEKWRPWIPNVQVGASGGGFGGGESTNFPSAAGRSDVDLLAVWEWQNLGLGNVARQRQRRGELHERVLEIEALRERIAAEVVEIAANVSSYREQIEIARDAIATAQKSFELNLQRIRAHEGLPIELLQSIAALADARDAYTEAVASYNRAQYRLMRAMGNPAGVPDEVVVANDQCHRAVTAHWSLVI